MPHVVTQDAYSLCAQPRGCLCAAASSRRSAPLDDLHTFCQQTLTVVKRLCRIEQNMKQGYSRQSSRLTMRSPRVSIARVVSAASSPTSDT